MSRLRSANRAAVEARLSAGQLPDDMNLALSVHAVHHGRLIMQIRHHQFQSIVAAVVRSVVSFTRSPSSVQAPHWRAKFALAALFAIAIIRLGARAEPAAASRLQNRRSEARKRRNDPRLLHLIRYPRNAECEKGQCHPDGHRDQWQSSSARFLIGPGKALDTDKYFIVCTDAIAKGCTTGQINSASQPDMKPRISPATCDVAVQADDRAPR